MTKVSVRSHAAASAVAAAPAPLSVRDSRGRNLGLRELTVLDQMRLLRRLGGENSPFFSFCMRLARVASIDGDTVHLPQTDIAFEALAQRLGEEGITALVIHEMSGGADDEVEDTPAAAKAKAEAQDAQERQTVKN
ncbi:hypothetical protein [Methylobacterium sp. P1-11]|uniref:hypothetical protein n=1 Tax=Methylobacterium sp. P1-11 TaxID=2024616 RepID=UPI0011F052CB|nr:hypothetical protein [Methylobacterium sp. P1-11]